MTIYNVDYHITDVCNLNCVSCNHFCPLVNGGQKHKCLEQIKADLLLLSKFRDEIEIVTIMGGEPTLHPQLSEIICFARRVFPFNEIHLTTNGVIADKLFCIKEELKRNRIKVLLSKYPFKEKWEEHYQNIINILGDDICEYSFEGDDGKGSTLMMQIKPLTNWMVSQDKDILNCRMRKGCTHLKDGKLYICNYAAHFNIFDDYFKGKHNIRVQNDDFVDLNTCTIDDIRHLVTESIPMLCKYCYECQRYDNLNMEKIPWRRSSLNIEEWLEQ